jgi:hypothetical protein
VFFDWSGDVEAKLPLLDGRVELERAMAEARLNEWKAFRAINKVELDQIKQTVLAKLRQRYGWSFRPIPSAKLRWQSGPRSGSRNFCSLTERLNTAPRKAAKMG